MIRFVQMGILCRCGEADVKCGLHTLRPASPEPKRKPKRRGK